MLSAGMITVIMLFGILYFHNPETAGFYPQCPSKLLTGYDCAGCGSLRGLHALMHGDIGAAWRFNPAIFVAFVVLALIGVSGLHRHRLSAKYAGKRTLSFSRRCAAITGHPAFPLSLLVLIVVWTIVRNL